MNLLDCWVIKTRIQQRLKIFLLIQVYWYCIPVSAKANGFSPWKFPCKCANCGSNRLVYARSCEIWRQEKEVLTIKHLNNILYYEACKLVVGSKTTTYSQAVQPNKSPYKYEMIVKTLIQLELGDWESFINKIKASELQMYQLHPLILQKKKRGIIRPNTDPIGENQYWRENGNKTNHVADKTPSNKISL